MDKRIEILVKPDGKVKIEAIGYSGPACEEATKMIEDALGVVEDREHKPEYWQSTTRTETGQQTRA